MKTLEFLSLKKKIHVSLVIDEEEKSFFKRIHGDEKRYEQILINFMSNALKFTNEDGQVQVIIKIDKF